MTSSAHRLLAFGMHLFVLFSAEHSLQLLPSSPTSIAFCVMASLLASYVYMTCAKTYDIFNYEAAYKKMGGNLNLLTHERDAAFYNTMLEHFSKMYTGIGFRWKLIEKPGVEAPLLDKLKAALLARIVPEVHAERESNAFLSSKEDEIRALEASVWRHDDTYGYYFILINPILVFASFYCGMGIFVLDVVILICLSQLTNMITHDDGRMEGESLLLNVLNAEEGLAAQREKQERLANGKVVSDYL